MGPGRLVHLLLDALIQEPEGVLLVPVHQDPFELPKVLGVKDDNDPLVQLAVSSGG